MQFVLPICSRDFWCFSATNTLLNTFSATNITSLVSSLPQSISNGPREEDGSIVAAADNPASQAVASPPVETLEPVEEEDPMSSKARTIQV